MSKSDPGNRSDAPATTAESPSGAINISEKKMLEHELLTRNVNEHTEKKQGLTYLSWAWAWAEALKVDPEATFEVKTFFYDQYTELPYMTINGTAMVWVTVTLAGRQRTCFLPVMDHRNKAIQTPDAFQVNTAIMRCMTKCLSLFGLGLYIYAGEDLPEDSGAKEEKPEPKKPEPKKEEVSQKEKDDLTLFADTLLQYLDIQRTKAALTSYWKSNQGQIDTLKVKMPDLYDLVLSKFKEAKEKAGE